MGQADGFVAGHGLSDSLLISVRKPPFSAISASICAFSLFGVKRYASAQMLDFLDLVKIAGYRIRNGHCTHPGFPYMVSPPFSCKGFVS